MRGYMEYGLALYTNPDIFVMSIGPCLGTQENPKVAAQTITGQHRTRAESIAQVWWKLTNKFSGSTRGGRNSLSYYRTNHSCDIEINTDVSFLSSVVRKHKD